MKDSYFEDETCDKCGYLLSYYDDSGKSLNKCAVCGHTFVSKFHQEVGARLVSLFFVLVTIGAMLGISIYFSNK